MRDFGQKFEHALQRRSRFGFQRKPQVTELGSKTHGADDAHWVFAIAGGRVANHAQDFFLGVCDAAVVVNHFARFGVVIHGVDGEVATRSIFVLRTPDVVAQYAATGVDCVFHAGEFLLAAALVTSDLGGVGVVEMGTECGDFDHLVFATTSIDHMDDTKASANDEGTSKGGLDLLWRGIGRDVKVFWLEA